MERKPGTGFGYKSSAMPAANSLEIAVNTKWLYIEFAPPWDDVLRTYIDHCLTFGNNFYNYIIDIR